MKKFFVLFFAFVILIFFVFTLSACSGKSEKINGNLSSSALNDNKASADEAKFDDEYKNKTNIKEQIIFEDNDVKVTAKKLLGNTDLDANACALKLLVENKSRQDYRIATVGGVYANNCVTGSQWSYESNSGTTEECKFEFSVAGLRGVDFNNLSTIDFTLQLQSKNDASEVFAETTVHVETFKSAKE